MNIHADLSLILAEGESYKVEFKERLAHLDREIVAFANADGGTIYVGIRDDNTICGIDITNTLKSQIMDIARNCDPSIRITLKSYKSERVLAVVVDAGHDKPYRCRDGFFLREGPSAQKLKRDEIVRLLSSSGQMYFDETCNERFTYPKDFSPDRLKTFLTSAGITHTFRREDILLSLGVCERVKQELKFNQAGVLFFAKDPQKWLSESFLTVVVYAGTDRFSILDKQDLMGSPIEQIDAALLCLKRHMHVEMQIVPGQARREEVYDYPLLAVREAIVNAVCHRDYYYDASHIYVHLYADRLEIENPGGLFRGLQAEELGQRSVRRNRLIADLLHRAGYIERVGSGFTRMQTALQEYNHPPLAVNATNFFTLRFYQRLPSKRSITLSDRQTRLYALFTAGKTLTKQQIVDATHLSSDTILRELSRLITYGLIEKQGTGRATEYGLVEN